VRRGCCAEECPIADPLFLLSVYDSLLKADFSAEKEPPVFTEFTLGRGGFKMFPWLSSVLKLGLEAYDAEDTGSLMLSLSRTPLRD
jgi:hypothetical protein